MKLYHFISLSLLLFIPAGLFIEKKFKIKRKFWCCHVNKFHKRGEIIIVMLIILALTAFTFLEAAPPLKPHYSFVGIFLLYGFRSLMEWKYARETKRYVLSLFSSLSFLFIFLGTELFFL